MKNKVLSVTECVLTLALLAVIVSQLYVMFSIYEETFESPVRYFKQNYGTDYITQYGNRYTEIREWLPPSTILSYIGEPNESFSMGCFNYVLTQYYLSPNLIYRNNNDFDTIIYNLYNSKRVSDATNFHLNNGWHIVKDFNNGLILLAK